MLSVLRKSVKYTCYGWLAFGSAHAIAATPSLHGQSGYISMPSAAVEADGTFSMGYSYDSPYADFWISSTFLPFLQVTGHYVAINGIPGFTNTPGAYGYGYGRYKDKVFDAKLQLLNESGWLPSVAVGATDLQGTELFKGQYVVATKTFGATRNIEASIGYGHKRPEGAFAGMRWTPTSLPRWSLVAEYDANDYKKDFQASQTFAGQRSKGTAVGVEYHWGWLGLQAARHKDHSSINAYVSIPFSDREFVPKITEPAYYHDKPAYRPSIEQWRHDASHAAALVNALSQQDFKNIRVQLQDYSLNLTLASGRISNLGRAVGRATRTALAFAPTGINSIHVTYTEMEQPIATFEFFNLDKLTDYLTGQIRRKEFLDSVLVRYANPDDAIHDDKEGLLAGVKDDSGVGVLVGHEGDIVQVSSEDREANRLKIAPKLGLYFNDPSGALRYDMTAEGNYKRRLGEGLYLESDLGLKIIENVSGVTQPSNSLLPHVRTDVADYKRDGRFKLYRLLLNKYMMPAERWYARASAGIYEEMFRGVGGQVLYLPQNSRWAADLSVDALQQRDFKGWFGKRDYNTVTVLGALHYRLPYGMTVTGRVGQFLAKDKGVRMELKRRFRSGIEVGAWVSYTNGHDITSPGTPSSPYHDKGIFMSIPLNTMLTSDTRADAGFTLSPWTRDVGQMVASPGDLYDMVENPRRDMTTFDGLGNFSERADEQSLPAVDPPQRTFGSPLPALRRRFGESTSALASPSDLLRGAGLAAGAILVAAASDKPIDNFVKKHSGRVTHDLDRIGKAIPIAMIGAAGMAFALGDERMQNTGLISLESVAAATGGALGLKYLVGRARPYQDQGPWSTTSSRANASFPSGHVTAAFAAVTPFAKEYDAPWLYGLAAVTAAGRMAGREHWFSDTVAGGLLGYATGSWLWNAQRDPSKGVVSVNPEPGGVAVAWRKAY